MKRHALFVGIDRYEDEQLHSLGCAENDASELHGFFKHRLNFDRTECLRSPSANGFMGKVEELVRRLEPGDLFVLFFAGHGYTHEGRHLLLCREARFSRLRHRFEVVPVDLLKDETARAGVHRLFVLDACRSDLLRTRDPAGAGFSGGAVLRDIVAERTPEVEAGALTILHSCAEGGQAAEIPALNGGLFRLALTDVLVAAAREGRSVTVGDGLQREIKQQMTRLAGLHGLSLRQQPTLYAGAELPPLVAGRPEAPTAQQKRPEPAAPPRLATIHPQPVSSAAGALARVRQEAERRRAELARRKELFERFYPDYEALRADAHVTADELAGAWRELCREFGVVDAPAEPWELEWIATGPEVVVGIRATREKPFTNSLGMRFVPVPGTDVLFSIWETRVQDYTAYAAANSGVDSSWKNPVYENVPVTPRPTHPVVNVSWDDAVAFAKWLTEKERSERKLTPGVSYRLPTDAEWSLAVGLKESSGGTPEDKSGKVADVYPWGKQWPPPKGAGNFADTSAKAKFPNIGIIDGYTDGYPTTSPVGSFAANQFGLFDLSGNVWEWCEDWCNNEQKCRVLRGGSWVAGLASGLSSSYRGLGVFPVYRVGDIGFRLVLVGSGGAR